MLLASFVDSSGWGLVGRDYLAIRFFRLAHSMCISWVSQIRTVFQVLQDTVEAAICYPPSRMFTWIVKMG